MVDSLLSAPQATSGYRPLKQHLYQPLLQVAPYTYQEQMSLLDFTIIR